MPCVHSCVRACVRACSRPCVYARVLSICCLCCPILRAVKVFSVGRTQERTPEECKRVFVGLKLDIRDLRTPCGWFHRSALCVGGDGAIGQLQTLLQRERQYVEYSSSLFALAPLNRTEQCMLPEVAPHTQPFVVVGFLFCIWWPSGVPSAARRLLKMGG
jgi:hypothetical protein